MMYNGKKLRGENFMKKLRTSCLILLVLLFTAIIPGCGSCENNSDYRQSSSVNKLQEAYQDADCRSPWATHGSDWSYISVDTNPYDFKDSYTYFSDATYAMQKIHSKLGLPTSLYESMLHTTALMGKQRKTFNSAGIEVSWSYHPDNGLNVMYELIF